MSDRETSGGEDKEAGVTHVLPRLLPHAHQHVATATNTNPTHNTSTVHYHNVLPDPARGERKEETDASGRTSEVAAIRELREQLARQQQMIAELLADRNINSAADTYRTPVSTSVKRSFNVHAQRSIQMPAGGASDLNVREYEAERESRVVGIAGMSLKDVLQTVGKYVVPFYADSSKDDKDRTVLEFVENVESVMGNLLVDNRSPHRLMLVQLCLRDGALAWMNRKLQELTDTDKGWRDFDRQPLTWDTDLRRPFIQAHLGTDTAELWLAKLETLKLGEGKTMTPIELDNQFDMIARHAFPTMTVGDDRTDMFLAPYYAKIVAKEKWLYTNILRSGGLPPTLKKWKQALSNAVTAEAYIKAATASTPWRGRNGSTPGGNRGRGGHAASGTSKPPTASAHVASTDLSEDRPEGVDYTGEGDEGQQQLSAALFSNRGGRGSRGGRGRGGGAAQAQQSKEGQQEWRRCYNCGKVGHLARACPSRQSVDLSTQQSKEQADQ
jgi:hypothetical protein